MNFYNKLPEYIVFLSNQYRNITLIGNQENSYVRYYNKTIPSDYIINNEYELIISEKYADINVYLYKSKTIHFTDITVPEYLIKPNITINFSKVKCDLSNSKIEIIKYNESSLSNKINDCTYNSRDEIMSCQIKESYF